MRHPFAVLVPIVLIPRLACPQGEPLGPEFRVNTFTSFRQGFPSVASGGADFVVVWHSFAEGYQGLGIRGQRYDNVGNPLGTEFRVNTNTSGTQERPAVSANASGAFVVVWRSNSSVGPQYDVFGQRYAASGAAVGPEFEVTPAGPLHDLPAVAVTPSGAFMVVWSQADYAFPPFPPFPSEIDARRYDASGVPQGPIFRVNTFPPSDQQFPSVAADAAGNFIVVWTSSFQDGSSYGVFGQRYAASGGPLGPEFRVNTYTPGSQWGATVAADLSGNFVVAWASQFSGNPPEPGLFAQRFASSGAPLGSEFRVNTSTAGYRYGQYGPTIAFDGGGNFVIVWKQNLGYPEGEVFGQRYSSLGEPSGSEFRVNTNTTGWQRDPSVASTLDGTFLVTWESGPIASSDVFAQRFGGIFPVKLQDFRVE